MSNIKASRRGDKNKIENTFGGVKDFLPTLKENLPSMTNSIFAKKDGLASLPDHLLPPQDPAPLYSDYSLAHDDYYHDDDDESHQADLNDLYSMLSDWSGGENLGELELPPTALEALNYQESNRESAKIDRRGGGKQRQEEYSEVAMEQRFINPDIQDSYYNLPKSF